MKRDKLIEIYKNMLLKIIKKLDVGRKNKFSNEFYLDYIFRILFYGGNTFYCQLSYQTKFDL